VADRLDLTGDIAAAVDGAGARGSALALGYIGDDLTFQGRARVEPSANDDVYANMIDGEKAQDPERKGVAVIIDVESVNGFGAEGPFRMERQAA
jgi:hypothetical protein